MKARNICFSIHNIYSLLENADYAYVGGAEVRIKKQIEYLQSSGVSIEIITYIPEKSEFRIIGKSGIIYYNLYHSGKNSTLLLISDLFSIFKSMKSIIIYKRAYDAYLLLYNLLARLFRKKIVFAVAADNHCNLHTSMSFNGFLNGLSYYLGVYLSSRIILQSDHQLQLISPSLLKKSTVIYKGTDESISDEKIPSFKERKYFLWVGRFSVEKRPELLKNLAKSGHSIKIAGRISEKYKNLLQELQKFPNIEYLGILNATELRMRYKEAIALLNTSDFEGFPETFIEAWIYGTPVISLKFLLNDFISEKGGIYAKRSIEKMIDAMNRLKNDPDYYKNLSDSSRQLIKDKYRFSKEMDALLKIFNELE